MTLRISLLQSSVLIIFSTLLISCEATSSSQKGKWSAEEKEKTRSEMELGLNTIGKQKDGSNLFESKEIQDKFLDCYVSKLEQTYSSYDESNKDLKGIEKISEECTYAVLLGTDSTNTATPEENTKEQ